MNYTIRVAGKELQAPAGSNLLELLREHSLAPHAPCGGKGSCGKCGVHINGEPALSCQSVVDRDMTVVLPETGETVILQKSEEHLSADGSHTYCMAFDIGTTTLVCYLYNGITGEKLAQKGCLNPQGSFGADVISRIQHVMNTKSDELLDLVRNAMEQLAEETAAAAGICLDAVTVASVVGNTAMHHLLLGFDPKPLTVPPYMPSVKAAQIYDDGNVQTRVLPNIAGFVGADTVGCMLSCDFDKRQDLTLLIDIGTNGEMVLGNANHRLACSTAAGPAFEGAKISCGMRGETGAVDHVWLENGQLRFHVIGETQAKGLCGSGLLDLTACLLLLEEISETGRMEQPSFTLPGTAISLTQKDVREVQLAKGAIRAGIELMCQHRGIRVEDIDTVLLAGAFGNYMDPVSACAIGMIPPSLLHKIRPVGNAAGTGAAMCALNREAFERAKHLAEETEFLELASMPQFQDRFVDCLLFMEEDDD